jgi:hypothetical protein
VAPAPTPSPSAAPRDGRGAIHVGPLLIRPRLVIGAVGLDTNVFYSPTNRRTDFFASGGPGLDVEGPLGATTHFTVSGNIGYLYFVRTPSQRKPVGGAEARFEANGSRTQATVRETYARTYSRPNFEVDRRIIQDREGTEVELRRRLFGRFAVRAGAGRSHNRAEDGQVFLGTDVGPTLTTDGIAIKAGVDYAVTVKTSFLLEGARDWSRFPSDTTRDSINEQLTGGIRVSSVTSLLSGGAQAGLGRFFPRIRGQFQERRYPVWNAEVLLRISPRTELHFEYGRRVAVSALTLAGTIPLLKNDIIEARLRKELVGRRVDLQVRGRITKLKTEGPVELDLGRGERTRGVRDDDVREAVADIGYRFRFRLRTGISGTYTDRSSPFADLGVRGLTIGFTILYN